MCVQQTVSDAYASATGARASGTSCSNAIGIRALQPDSNPTRPEESGQVQNSRVRVGSGKNYLLSGRVEFSNKLQPSNRYGVRFAYSYIRGLTALTARKLRTR